MGVVAPRSGDEAIDTDTGDFVMPVAPRSGDEASTNWRGLSGAGVAPRSGDEADEAAVLDFAG